jgi:hypothetical protein
MNNKESPLHLYALVPIKSFLLKSEILMLFLIRISSFQHLELRSLQQSWLHNAIIMPYRYFCAKKTSVNIITRQYYAFLALKLRSLFVCNSSVWAKVWVLKGAGHGAKILFSRIKITVFWYVTPCGLLYIDLPKLQSNPVSSSSG